MSRIRLAIFTAILSLSFFIPFMSPKTAYADECTREILTTTNLQAPEDGEYSVWVRYRAEIDSSLQIGLDGDCKDMQLIKTDQEWKWTNKTLIGTQQTLALSKNKKHVFNTSGNEYIELDTVLFLAVGQVCSDGSAVPKGDGKNCQKRSQAKTVPIESQTCGEETVDFGTEHADTGHSQFTTSLSDEIQSGTIKLPSLNSIESIPITVKKSAVQVDYYFDEVLVGSSTAEKEVDLDTSKFCNGIHTLKVVATDGNGNTHTFYANISTLNERGFLSYLANLARFNKGPIAILLGLLLLLSGAAIYWHVKKHKKIHSSVIAQHAINNPDSISPTAHAGHTIHSLKIPKTLIIVFGVLALFSGTAMAATINASDKTIHVWLEFENFELTEIAKITEGSKSSGSGYVSFGVRSENGEVTFTEKEFSDTNVVTPSLVANPIEGLPGSSPAPTTTSPGGTPNPVNSAPPVNEDPSFPIIPTSAEVLSAWRINDSQPAPPILADTHDEGAFRLICMPSHLSYDDPIVYPGQVGAAHLHMFFGNTLANANSTWTSLRSTGDSTCQSGPINRSAYWAPALLNGSGQVVMADTAIVYYKGFQNTVNLPRGLRYIAGYNPANPNQTYGNPFPPGIPGGRTSEYQPTWRCIANDGSQVGILQTTIPTSCPVDGQILGTQIFPYCWDGRIDSSNHRDHVVFPLRPAGSLECPSTHPTEIPRYTLTLAYSVRAGDNLSQWHLSSDRMPGSPNLPNGSSLHADWFGAWDQTVLETWTELCIRQIRSCSASQYGDGTLGRQPTPWNWENPNRLVPIP